MTITRLNPEYAAVGHTHPGRLVTNAPAGSTAAQLCDNAEVNVLYQWANYSSASYSPTGSNGGWTFRLLNTYSTTKNYTVLEAYNYENGRYFTYSRYRDSWTEH